jgi:dihydroorotase
MSARHFPHIRYWSGSANDDVRASADAWREGEIWLDQHGALSATPIAGAVSMVTEAGACLLPGAIDLYARLREPGAAHKASIASELQCAARNGVTSVLCAPDTAPMIDSTAVVELVRDRARAAALQQSAARVFPLGALTKNLSEENLSELATLKRAGCVAMSNADSAIVNSALVKRALQYAASVDVAVHLHPIDRFLSDEGCAHDGRVAARLGLSGIPEHAETLALARDLMLIAATGVRAHISRISTARSVAMIAEAKQRGLQITCDVAIANLFLCENDLLGYRANAHVQPPLRTAEDRDALRAGVANGVIDAICSNHAPHDRDAKLAPFPMTEPGASTLDALLPLSLQLVDEGVLSWRRMLQALVYAPAEIAVVPVQDWIVMAPNERRTLSAESIYSRGKNSPFLGWELRGVVQHSLFAN